jgi:hypothetical protein
MDLSKFVVDEPPTQKYGPAVWELDERPARRRTVRRHDDLPDPPQAAVHLREVTGLHTVRAFPHLVWEPDG